MVNRYTEDKFDENTESTIGAQFSTKIVDFLIPNNLIIGRRTSSIMPFPASPSPSSLSKNAPEEILPREDGTRVRVKLQIWDTAGEERFRSVAPMYYKNASAIILVYDSTNRTSFKALESWVQEIDDNATEDLLIVSITASKCD